MQDLFSRSLHILNALIKARRMSYYNPQFLLNWCSNLPNSAVGCTQRPSCRAIPQQGGAESCPQNLTVYVIEGVEVESDASFSCSFGKFSGGQKYDVFRPSWKFFWDKIFWSIHNRNLLFNTRRMSYHIMGFQNFEKLTLKPAWLRISITKRDRAMKLHVKHTPHMPNRSPKFEGISFFGRPRGLPICSTLSDIVS